MVRLGGPLHVYDMAGSRCALVGGKGDGARGEWWAARERQESERATSAEGKEIGWKGQDNGRFSERHPATKRWAELVPTSDNGLAGPKGVWPARKGRNRSGVEDNSGSYLAPAAAGGGSEREIKGSGLGKRRRALGKVNLRRPSGTG